FILMDGDVWGTEPVIRGRRRLSFLERKGEYWGAPADDAAAIEEIERLRRVGVGFAVTAWPVFWWREYYVGLFEHLRTRYRCVLDNDVLLAFDLRHPGGLPVGRLAREVVAAR